MSEENIRVVALYRASTKGQTDKDNNNDIPTQRKIVQDFIYSKGWNITREFTEGGVSGFKISEKDRDALQIIKAMALNNEFDILVVYMSDRIGRLKDETPLVIKFLYDHNVKVISATEGEIKNETHTDSLLTYIRYWQAEGESIKTRQRVTDYLIEAVKEGRFRGGNCIPLGYMLIDNGSKNFKGRHIKDFVINPEEVELVKLIYYLSMKMNYGQRKIAIYLNENGYRTRGGQPWKSASIQLILSNPIYKGQFKIYSKLYDKEVVSPIMEHLIIIPEVEWNENRKIIEARTNKKDKSTPKNTSGKLLLSGIAYCGHCGEKLTTYTETHKWKNKDGTERKKYAYRYRCMSFYKKGAVNCDGQTAYGAKKINTLVIDETKAFLIELQGKNLNDEFLKNINKQIKEFQIQKNQKQNELNESYKELKILKDEVVKSLMGKSNFTPEMLKGLLSEKESTISLLDNELNNFEIKIKKLSQDLFSYKGLSNELCDWGKRFDEASEELKKSMILSVIDRIDVFKDSIDISFNIKIEQYKANSHMSEVQHSSTSYTLFTWVKNIKIAS